ncbi:hypothetical protein [uncultured Azohydromonas sp.]|jgi:hypothetical protein|uniref:hypothetical protein n=1 Tax=uncultured Azohydromonas sp. TaxID=487342 RepID=UPI00262662EA|nr:hypothetical protein [uncultured Azohydromonas sp.]
MSWATRMGTLALVALSGTAGWMLHGLMQPAPPAAAAPAPADPASRASLLAFPAAPTADADRVELHPDGSASIQVRQRPPAWVLGELCRQGARGLAGCGSGGVPIAAAPASGTAQTLSRLKNPDAQARLQALMQARDEGQALPEGTLQALMASDPSEQVRLEAFDSYIEGRSGTMAEMRAALQAVLRIPDAALQARAREQLDELEDAYRDDGAVPQ